MQVICSDESTFETGQRAREFVTRRPYDKYCPDCLNHYKHSGRRSVMVWGAICGDQASILEELKMTEKTDRAEKKKKSIGSKDYIEQILEPFLKPWYKRLKEKGRRPIFMQDNAAIHTSKEVRLWLRQNRIEVMEWPPGQS